ncbi:11489_t:CDS:1, partial [Gigaspora margarita]
FDLAFYLDSVGTSNKGLNMIVSLGVTTTTRSVDRKKILDLHNEYVERLFQNI